MPTLVDQLFQSFGIVNYGWEGFCCKSRKLLPGRSRTFVFNQLNFSPLSFVVIRSASSQRHFNSSTNRSGWHLAALPATCTALHVSKRILQARLLLGKLV